MNRLKNVANIAVFCVDTRLSHELPSQLCRQATTSAQQGGSDVYVVLRTTYHIQHLNYKSVNQLVVSKILRESLCLSKARSVSVPVVHQ